MKKYSITKYSDNNKDDWTAICDIGKVYNGRILSAEEYKKVEDAYVSAILEIVDYMKIDTLRIKDVFRWKDLKEDVEKAPLHISQLYTDSMFETYEKVNDNSDINRKMLDDLIRLELREDIGGMIYVPYRLKIFIGYDYLMGVHSSIELQSLFEGIKNSGLSIFRFE